MDVAADHVRMNAGGSLRQFPFSFFCFWIMDNNMDWGISFDIAYLPDVSMYAKEVVRYHLLFHLAAAEAFFRSNILTGFCQSFIERRLYVN